MAACGPGASSHVKCISKSCTLHPRSPAPCGGWRWTERHRETFAGYCALGRPRLAGDRAVRRQLEVVTRLQLLQLRDHVIEIAVVNKFIGEGEGGMAEFNL